MGPFTSHLLKELLNISTEKHVRHALSGYKAKGSGTDFDDAEHLLNFVRALPEHPKVKGKIQNSELTSALNVLSTELGKQVYGEGDIAGSLKAEDILACFKEDTEAAMLKQQYFKARMEMKSADAEFTTDDDLKESLSLHAATVLHKLLKKLDSETQHDAISDITKLLQEIYLKHLPTGSDKLLGGAYKILLEEADPTDHISKKILEALDRLFAFHCQQNLVKEFKVIPTVTVELQNSEAVQAIEVEITKLLTARLAEVDQDVNTSFASAFSDLDAMMGWLNGELDKSHDEGTSVAKAVDLALTDRKTELDINDGSSDHNSFGSLYVQASDQVKVRVRQALAVAYATFSHDEMDQYVDRMLALPNDGGKTHAGFVQHAPMAELVKYTTDLNEEVALAKSLLKQKQSLTNERPLFEVPALELGNSATLISIRRMTSIAFNFNTELLILNNAIDALSSNIQNATPGTPSAQIQALQIEIERLRSLLEENNNLGVDLFDDNADPALAAAKKFITELEKMVPSLTSITADDDEETRIKVSDDFLKALRRIPVLLASLALTGEKKEDLSSTSSMIVQQSGSDSKEISVLTSESLKELSKILDVSNDKASVALLTAIQQLLETKKKTVTENNAPASNAVVSASSVQKSSGVPNGWVAFMMLFCMLAGWLAKAYVDTLQCGEGRHQSFYCSNW